MPHETKKQVKRKKKKTVKKKPQGISETEQRERLAEADRLRLLGNRYVEEGELAALRHPTPEDQQRILQQVMTSRESVLPETAAWIMALDQSAVNKKNQERKFMMGRQIELGPKPYLGPMADVAELTSRIGPTVKEPGAVSTIPVPRVAVRGQVAPYDYGWWDLNRMGPSALYPEYLNEKAGVRSHPISAPVKKKVKKKKKK